MIITKKPSIVAPVDEDTRLFCCWNLPLASYTRRRREQLGLSLERAAELAGLELSEWHALEAGWVPEDLHLIGAIAATLQTSWADYSLLAFMMECQEPEPKTIN